ncbi:thiamine phosphate synthase [Halococcus sp. AFM35]|uniref:thiamine phosphate synthase n=1 Tax=Halococcus sp. AFM35 TaxID=3421653 RepID=UPI003EBFD102
MNISGTYLVTQASHSRGRSTGEIAASAIDAGVGTVQLREKHTSVRERYDLATDLRERTRAAGVTFIVNDRVDLAVAVDADGVHLGDDDLPIAAARELLGPEGCIGRSVSTVSGARAAERAGADYLGVGAVFATTSKDVSPDESAIGVETVAEVADAVDIPIVGIGGITPDNAGEVVAAGADGVAVISAITAADDAGAATRRLTASIEEGAQ